jgi:hypothetical protein
VIDITLLGDTDTVVRDIAWLITVIDVALFLVIFIQYSLRCISIIKKSNTSITMIYHAMSDCTVSVSLRGVICLSQWFITLYLRLYCINITKKSATSITVINHAMSLTTVSVTVVRHSMINHCDRRITLLSDTDTVQSKI